MSSDDETPPKKEFPYGQWLLHLVYVGGMIGLHTGLGASVTVANKESKCPVSEWGRHLVYVGGFVALAVKAGMAWNKPAIEEEMERGKPTDCPVNEFWRHAAYTAGVIGVMAMVNARKK